MPQKSRRHKKGAGARRERRTIVSDVQSRPVGTATAAPPRDATAAAPVVSATKAAVKAGATAAPVADYSHIKKEMKKLGIIWGAMFLFLIILSFFIR
jgi:hypothetical protein